MRDAFLAALLALATAMISGALLACVMNRVGNLAERDYDVGEVAECLRSLVKVAPSMLLVVHCGGDWESLDCVATIRVGEGVAAVGKPEIEKLAEIGDDQALANMLRAMTGGY